MIAKRFTLLISRIIFATIISLGILCVSCDEKDEPVFTAPIVDTYVIVFTGDCDKFKGYVSVSATDPDCYLNSTSFENQSSISLSDSQFKGDYDFTSSHYDKSADHHVKIQCTALCISEHEYSMKCTIYVMQYYGEVLMYEKEFVSYKPDADPKPTSKDYTFTLEI